MKTHILSALCLLSLCACSARPAISNLGAAAGDIVHGSDVRKGSDDESLSKSVVALDLKGDEGEGLCTGSILDDQTILTAAHCVSRGEEVTVVFGTQTKRAKTTREGDAALINPQWNRSGDSGDLAVIHFSGGLPEGYRPVELATTETQIVNGTEVEFLGYGISNASKRSGAGTLRETTTTVIAQPKKDQYMTDGSTSSVCFGDSGGPAFVKTGENKMVQWGVAHAVLDESCDQASVHTSVQPYLRWIERARLMLSGRTAELD